MKKTLTTLFLCVAFFSFCQEKKFIGGAMMAEGITAKSDFTITIKDSLFLLEGKHAGEPYTIDYDIINSRNGITYVSDGVETHKFSYSGNSGKKKGFQYSDEIIFQQHNGTIIVYYIKEE